MPMAPRLPIASRDAVHAAVVAAPVHMDGADHARDVEMLLEPSLAHQKRLHLFLVADALEPGLPAREVRDENDRRDALD